MRGWGGAWASLLLVTLTVWPVSGEAWTSALWVVKERAYRVGVLLVVDAVVENVSAQPVHWAEVSVEFYTFFDELLSVEHTVLRPSTLRSGHTAMLRVVTPYSNAVRKIGYRFTWWQEGVQLQDVATRDLRLK